MIRLTVKFDLAPFRRWCTSRARALREWGQGPIQGSNAMLEALEQYHADLFATNGASGLGRASGVGPWAALKLRTLRARAGRIRASKIPPFDYAAAPGWDRTLTWSMRLYKSLAGKGNSYGDAIRHARARGITFGTRTPTALIHAAGRAGRNPMPKRMALDDKIGPQVAIDVAEARILAYLLSDSDSSPGPGLRINAAGFYGR